MCIHKAGQELNRASISARKAQSFWFCWREIWDYSDLRTSKQHGDIRVHVVLVLGHAPVVYSVYVCTELAILDPKRASRRRDVPVSAVICMGCMQLGDIYMASKASLLESGLYEVSGFLPCLWLITVLWFRRARVDGTQLHR